MMIKYAPKTPMPGHIHVNTVIVAKEDVIRVFVHAYVSETGSETDCSGLMITGHGHGKGSIKLTKVWSLDRSLREQRNVIQGELTRKTNAGFSLHSDLRKNIISPARLDRILSNREQMKNLSMTARLARILIGGGRTIDGLDMNRGWQSWARPLLKAYLPADDRIRDTYANDDIWGSW